MRAPTLGTALLLVTTIATTMTPTRGVAQALGHASLARLGGASRAQADAAAQPTNRLSLDDAVRLALEQNIDLRIEQIAPQIQDQQIALTKTAFSPSLTSELTVNGVHSPPDSFLAGSEGGGTLETGLLRTTASMRQQLPTRGTSYVVAWDGSRSTTNSVFANFNPRLNSNLSLSVTQPLLRNLRTDATRTQLVISRRNRAISDAALRALVVQTVRSVKNAYWDLKYAVANLDVQRQSLELAQQVLRDNRTRVQVGTMAPIDIVEAEAEVARNEEAMIVAEAAIAQAEDQLRTIVYDPRGMDFWLMKIDPTDAPRLDPVAVDVGSAIRTALGQRTDLQRARQNLANVADNVRFYRDQMRPEVNLQADYSMAGLGGQQFLRGPGFPGPVVGSVSRRVWNVLGDVLTSDFPTWTLGVAVSYPLGTTSAEVNAARTGLEEKQAVLQIENIELQVARQVRDIGRQVTTNIKRIDATRAARTLAERRLDAEQRKFTIGTSTSFLVFQAQRELATSRANELRAVLDYNKSLADFEAVQEASISGPDLTIR